MTIQTDVLLVVATDCEAESVLAEAGFDKKEPALIHGIHRTYFNLGEIGGARTVMVQTEAGTATVGGSLATVMTAISETSPSTIIMVGIAFGVSKEKQPIGTVLVSKQVQQYEVQRVGTGENGAVAIIPRGDKVSCSPSVLNRLRAARAHFGSTVKFGLLLSGEKLVDNLDYREELTKVEPEALGGEMEAGGVYVAAVEHKAEWCVVKAVCDYADGQKKQNKAERQRVAAARAAGFVFRALRQGGFASRKGTEPDLDTASPKLLALSDTRGKSSGDESSGPRGWSEVGQQFLEREARTVQQSDLLEYFDGEDPDWGIIGTARLPVRSVVSQLEQELTDARTPGAVTVHLVVGPGGEGKSTAVMQVAAALAHVNGWHVLWRQRADRARLHWSDLKASLSEDTALCLVVDDAHEVRDQLESFLERRRTRTVLGANQGASLHLILCAHTDDWARHAPHRVERWHRRATFKQHDLTGVSLPDALLLVRSYGEQAAVGEMNTAHSDNELAKKLVAAASSRAGSEASLLGALIETRKGVPLEVHVERMLHRAATASLETGLPVLGALVSTAAVNAAGVHRLDIGILAAATNISETTLDSTIAQAEAELRTDGRGTNRAVRVRHSSIGRIMADLAFNAPAGSEVKVDKPRAFAALATAAVQVIPQFWRSNRAQPVLDLCVRLRSSDADAAVAVAEGAVEGAPADIHLRSKLAQTYREVARDDDPAAAVATCEEFAREFGGKFVEGAVRALIREWAMASGLVAREPDHRAQSLWLALWSFSDQVGGGSLSRSDLKHLPTVTRAIQLVREGLDDARSARCAAVVVQVGKHVPGTPHLDVARELAGKASADIKDLVPTFQALSKAAWRLVTKEFRSLQIFPADGTLTFRTLHGAAQDATRRRPRR